MGISLTCCLNQSFMNCSFYSNSISLAPNPDLMLTKSTDCKRFLLKGLTMFPNFSMGAHTECLLDTKSYWAAELRSSSLGQRYWTCPTRMSLHLADIPRPGNFALVFLLAELQRSTVVGTGREKPPVWDSDNPAQLW